MVGGLIVAVGVSLLSGVASERPIPTPIGLGPGYRIPATPPAVRRAEPIANARCRFALHAWSKAHVEVFARRRVVVIPAGIGMAPPLTRDGAFVTGARCSYPVRTSAPTGVVEVAHGFPATVGELFAIWGQALTRKRLAGFRGRVLAFVSGRRWHGDVRAIRLAPHAQIVLETGGYVRPHRLFLFPAGS